MARVKTASSLGSWKNWDQLVAIESGGAVNPSDAAIRGAENCALYALNKKSAKWTRPIWGHDTPKHSFDLTLMISICPSRIELHELSWQIRFDFRFRTVYFVRTITGMEWTRGLRVRLPCATHAG